MTPTRQLLRPRTFGLLALTAATIVPAWSYSPVPPPWIHEVFLGEDVDEVPANVQPVILWGRSRGGPGLYLWDAEGRPVAVEREIHDGAYTRFIPTEPLAPGAYQLASVYGHPEGVLDTATGHSSGDSAVPYSGDTEDTSQPWGSQDTSDTGSYRRPGRWGEGQWFTVVDDVDDQPPQPPVVIDAYLVGTYVQLELEDPSEPVIVHTRFLRDGMPGWESTDLRVLEEADTIPLGLDGKAPYGRVEVTYVDRAGNAAAQVTVPVDPSMTRSANEGPLAGCGGSNSQAMSGGCQQGTGSSGLGILGLATLLGWRRRR